MLVAFGPNQLKAAAASLLACHNVGPLAISALFELFDNSALYLYPGPEWAHKPEVVPHCSQPRVTWKSMKAVPSRLLPRLALHVSLSLHLSAAV